MEPMTTKNILCRYVIVGGNATKVISKMWVDKGGPDDVSLELKQQWGAFPDFPPKPPKKTEQK